ncbi:hypothetical protein, conserved [Eimeria maxima]|uniref:Uncharacterized protein n=1 Tax=Eimeria maxima TaxID=5804 RepID=U6MHS8_EIMMA|nr:hypothetical protein, conserved [Eimeria maxima]CDJ61205.1 hypothetical protein, conserved [Eimeria maxima]
MRKMIVLQLDTLQEMEWHFRMLENATRKRAAKQVENIRRVAINKCSGLIKKLQSTKTQLDYYQKENEELHANFEERVKEFKEQMPKSMQELDAQWHQRMEELRGVIMNSQGEIENLQEQQDELLRSLEAYMRWLGGGGGAAAAASSSSSSSNLKELLPQFGAALRSKLQQHEAAEIKSLLRLMIENAAADKELTEEELQQQEGYKALQERAAELTAQVEALKQENDKEGSRLLDQLAVQQHKCCSKPKKRTNK